LNPLPISIVKIKSVLNSVLNSISILANLILRPFCYFFLLTFCGLALAQATPEDYDEEDIEIVEGDDQTVYEYRQNGILMMIKIVPTVGKTYYMVPADGSAHFESLDHKKKLYPQWVLFEW
jgi:hypothetical protein